MIRIQRPIRAIITSFLNVHVPSIRPCLLGAFASSLFVISSSAQITNNFTEGEGSSTADQYPGAAADGWVEGWTTLFGTSSSANAFYGNDPHVISTSPLNGGGNYLNAGLANGEITMRRRYSTFGDLDVSLTHIIEFDLRLDDWLPSRSQFNNANDYITICTRPNTGSGTSENRSSFWIKALGANGVNGTANALAGRWNFYEGNPTSTSEGAGTFTNSPLPAVGFGVTYHFKITTDPTTKSYVGSVSDGTNTFTTGSLRWRNVSDTSEGNRTNTTYLTFGSRTSTRSIQPAATETNFLSIDNITINHLPFDEFPPKITQITPQLAHVYYPASSNLSFSTLTIGPTNTLPSSNVVLTLNGVNVSSSLSFSGSDTDTNRIITYTGLRDMTIYNGVILVKDQAGRSFSNSFFFDTFIETNVAILEAENYNFGPELCNTRTNSSPNGYLQNPLLSAFDSDNGAYINEEGGYVNRKGISGVDYFDLNGDTSPDFRACDPVGVRKKTSGDYERPAYTALGIPEFIVEKFVTNEWCNYTHIWPDANYLVYLRVGAGVDVQFQLDRVTSDRTQPNQTTNKLGIFDCPRFVARETLIYRPLLGTNGSPALLHLSGEETLRLTSLNAPANDQTYVNFMLFVPVNPGLVLRNPTVNGSTFSFNLGTTSGFNYVVEYKEDLNNAGWTTLTNITGTGGSVTVNDTISSASARYYRARQP